MFPATLSQVNIHTDFVTSFKLYFTVARPAFALVIILYFLCSSNGQSLSSSQKRGVRSSRARVCRVLNNWIRLAPYQFFEIPSNNSISLDHWQHYLYYSSLSSLPMECNTCKKPAKLLCSSGREFQRWRYYTAQIPWQRKSTIWSGTKASSYNVTSAVAAKTS